MKNSLRKTLAEMAAFTLAICSLTACSNNNTISSSLSNKNSVQITPEAKELDQDNTDSDKSTGGYSKASYTVNTNSVIDTTDMFSKRDLEQSADLTDAVSMKVSDEKTLTITEAGIYVISGKAKNCTIKIEADNEAKVQLVLNDVDVENEDFPVIYAVSADKVFITSAEGSANLLSVNNSFTSDGDTNTDAVIFSKDDIVLNGTGSLTINSACGNGISSKDDIKVTNGNYIITSAEDAVEANDSIAVCGGDFIIKTDKDGFHAENDEDSSLGYIYIADGNFDINSSSDGIQGTTYVQIDGGTFDITSSEGIEATYVQINGGDITISASDDGINASRKSDICDVVVEFNGGNTTITMGQGDTDGVDANGSIYVNGGTINVNAQMSSFDYDVKAEFNGGTIIINGEEVSEIPQFMMGGPMGGHGGMGGFGGGRGNGSEDFGTPPDGFTPPDDFTPPENFDGQFEGKFSGRGGFAKQ